MSENQRPESERPMTIDAAILECENNIRWHRIYSCVMVVLLFACAGAFYSAFKSQELTMQSITDLMNFGKINDSASSITEWTARKSHIYFAFVGLFVVIFGIIVAVYRFHLVEITRNEQIKLGFWRIRIAANSPEPGFQSEVREALTRDAFSFDRTAKPEKGKKIESPVPGHPGADLATAFLNKLLENAEIDISKKRK